MRPDGTVLENRNRRLPNGGLVMVYTDITETKRIEAALRQSEQRYALALSGVGPQRGPELNETAVAGDDEVHRLADGHALGALVPDARH